MALELTQHFRLDVPRATTPSAMTKVGLSAPQGETLGVHRAAHVGQARAKEAFGHLAGLIE